MKGGHVSGDGLTKTKNAKTEEQEEIEKPTIYTNVLNSAIKSIEEQFHRKSATNNFHEDFRFEVHSNVFYQ